MENQTQAADNNSTANYPIQVQIPYPEKSSRLLAFSTLVFFIKMILLIPHLFVLYFLGIFSMIASIAAQIFILVKGVYPPNMFALIKGVSVWQLRMNSYMFGLTDQYPPLAIDEADRAKSIIALKKILLGIVIFFAVMIILILLTNK